MYQIETIANLIEEANLATLNKDMFLYSANAEMNNGIILYPSNDPPIIDPDTPRYFKGKFQIIVRNMRYEQGIALCENLSNALTLFNKDTPAMFIKYVRPLYQARVYRRSDSGIIEFSVTYEIRFVAK
jgi:hypothetical protein